MATPLHTVKQEFGSKDALVEKLSPLLERREDEDDAGLKDRLSRVSNNKLLRLWERENLLRDQHGSRDGLVDKIIALRFGEKGDPAHRRTLMALSTGRLLSMHTGLVHAAKR